MNNKCIKLILCTVIFMSTFTFINVSADNEKIGDQLSEVLGDSSLESLMAKVEGDISSTSSYYEVYTQWQKLNAAVPNQVIMIDPSSYTGGEIVDIGNSNGYEKNVIKISAQESITFNFNVSEAGLYEFNLDYFVNKTSKLSPTVSIKVNEKTQYNEMNELLLPVNWEVIPNPVDKNTDRYGNELPPRSTILSKWYSEKLGDPNNFYVEPLKFYLNEGMNEITITVNQGEILLGDISFSNEKITIPSYEQYLNNLNQKESELNELITIEAENILYKSRQSIRSRYIRDPQVTPYDYKVKVLNILDGQAYAEPGDFVTYEFNVEEAGFYELALKYMIVGNEGVSSFRTIYIDDEIPFDEFSNYQFTYSSSWKNETLSDNNGNPYKIYLDKGKHQIKLAINNNGVKDVYHNLISVLRDIEKVDYNLKKITGGVVDENRDWKLNQYYASLRQELIDIANKIDKSIKDMHEYYGKNSPFIEELEIAKSLVLKYTKNERELNKITYTLYRFSESETSAYGRINKMLPNMLFSPLQLDKIYFNNNQELPKPKANIFVSATESIKSFFYTFFDTKYNEGMKTDENTINIWVNKSRLYVEMMQRMFDEQFTPNTGIKVNLSLLPDENKILLVNAAGNIPDAVISMGQGKVYDLAIRGILENVREKDGFYELSDDYNRNSFTHYIHEDGIYGLPETQDVKLLFYRTDIFRNIGIEPPQTWEEVLDILPVLQKYNKDFYNPLGGVNAFKTYGDTLPFIYQFGGEIYNPLTGNETIINEEGGFKAFEFMTDLFTIYNVPTQTANFYQHFRNGKIPVGIGGVNEYIQLKYAAPELAGQWDILPVPGVMNEDGVVERWDPTYGSASVLFKDATNKEKAWEALKWWHSAETQSAFSYEIQSTLGSKFLYMTANVEAFKTSAWPSESKDEVLEQWKWIRLTGKVPGDYMLERELSNAWNKVVLDGKNPRTTLDDIIKDVNKEINRKLEEFGYVVDGELVTPYKVPTIETIDEWFTPRK